MAGLWYRVGTVSVTNGSKKVTGFGTKWKTSVSKPDKGHPVHAPDGRIYELDYVESDTVLWLVSSYAGPSAADQSYAIDIPRTGTVPAFSRDLSAFVAYHQGQMDGWQQLLTGTGDVTLTAPDGTKKTVPSWEAGRYCHGRGCQGCRQRRCGGKYRGRCCAAHPGFVGAAHR